MEIQVDKAQLLSETALSLPAIVLAICIVLLSINIGINYMKIQDIAQSCSRIIQRNDSTEQCYNLPEKLSKRCEDFFKNINYTQIIVKKV